MRISLSPPPFGRTKRNFGLKTLRLTCIHSSPAWQFTRSARQRIPHPPKTNSGKIFRVCSSEFRDALGKKTQRRTDVIDATEGEPLFARLLPQLLVHRQTLRREPKQPPPGVAPVDLHHSRSICGSQQLLQNGRVPQQPVKFRQDEL